MLCCGVRTLFSSLWGAVWVLSQCFPWDSHVTVPSSSSLVVLKLFYSLVAAVQCSENPPAAARCFLLVVTFFLSFIFKATYIS